MPPTNPQEYVANVEDQQLTEEELGMLKNMSTPTSEEKNTIFTFFNKIISKKDSIKVSNLEKNELNAVRLLRKTASYGNIMGWDFASQFIADDAEVILGSSLSKGGFLIQQAVTQKRELRTRNIRNLQKKGLFSRPQPEGEGEQQ